MSDYEWCPQIQEVTDCGPDPGMQQSHPYALSTARLFLSNISRAIRRKTGSMLGASPTMRSLISRGANTVPFRDRKPFCLAYSAAFAVLRVRMYSRSNSSSTHFGAVSSATIRCSISTFSSFRFLINCSRLACGFFMNVPLSLAPQVTSLFVKERGHVKGVTSLLDSFGDVARP